MSIENPCSFIDAYFNISNILILGRAEILASVKGNLQLGGGGVGFVMEKGCFLSYRGGVRI